MKSKTTLFFKNEFTSHPNRCLFSSKCSQGGHSVCSGGVNKSRNPSGICVCPCHEVDQD